VIDACPTCGSRVSSERLVLDRTAGKISEDKWHAFVIPRFARVREG